jgi:phenylalanine-4-hydroxylase
LHVLARHRCVPIRPALSLRRSPFVTTLIGSSCAPPPRHAASGWRRSGGQARHSCSHRAYPAHSARLTISASSVQRCSAARLHGSDSHYEHGDAQYAARRLWFAGLAATCRLGTRLAWVAYTEQEHRVWASAWRALSPLLQRHACSEYLEQLHNMRRLGVWQADRLPQPHSINEYLQQRTGFSIHPVAGLVSPRAFLAGLACRVCYYSLFVRHASSPSFSPEPDVVHQLIGHTPLLGNKQLADLSQAFGLASLGASDSELEQIDRCYWYTMECGLCMEGGQRKAFGAGLLSSAAELQNAISPTVLLSDYRPFEACNVPFQLSCLQPFYFISPSMSAMQSRTERYLASFHRPFCPSDGLSSESMLATSRVALQ